ncbi:MAG: DUF4434 domain-containing protein [bacterium]|nr:DUF4434 domain-containing protein [Candidatus Sumerlaeota bacterium]
MSMADKPDNSTTDSLECSDALHYHYLVRNDRRAAYSDIICRSLVNYPKERRSDEGNAAAPTRPCDNLVPITGSFFVLGDTPDDSHWISPNAMQKELGYMHEIGMDTIVITTGIGDKVCYPSSVLRHAAKSDLLDMLLRQAGSLGMSVFVGLPSLLVDWMIATDEELDRVCSTTRQLAAELAANYGGHKSFHGWYLSYELCNVFIENRSDPRILPAWIGRLRTICKDVAPDKPVMIAPYFTSTMPLERFEALWDMVMDQTKVDILAMQDGVGIYGGDRLAEVDAHFSILRKLCDRRMVSLWADLEIFQQISGIPFDQKPWSAIPASVDRLTEQIMALSCHVRKIVMFCFSSYMSPAASQSASMLFDAYKSEWNLRHG